MNTVYGSQLLDDFHHLQANHGDKLHDILIYAQNNLKFSACDRKIIVILRVDIIVSLLMRVNKK